MKKEDEVKENKLTKMDIFLSATVFLFLFVLLCGVIFYLYQTFNGTSDEKNEKTGWQLMTEEVTPIDEIRFDSSWKQGNQISMDTEIGTLVLDVIQIDYFVSTDQPSYFEIKMFEEKHNEPKWLPDFLKARERKRAMLTVYINESDTKDVSRRFADELGRTLIFIEGENFTGELKDSFTSLPYDFDIDSDDFY